MNLFFRFFLFSSVFLFFHSGVTGFSDPPKTNSRKLIWEDAQTMRFSEEESIRFLSFQNAGYNNDYYLPSYSEEFTHTSAQPFEVELKNIVTVPFKREELEGIKYLNKIPANLECTTQVLFDQGKPSGIFSFIPIIKTANGYEKILSFEYSIKIKNPASRTAASPARVYADNSVLATGTWAKIAVVKDGIYKLNFSFIDSLGIGSSINPGNIRIYGHGGGMLPEKNSVFRYDDLIENAIFVNDNNGVLDSSDYVLFYGQGPHKWLYDSLSGTFKHQLNIYSDTTFYFITSDAGSGIPKRILDQASLTQAATKSVTSFNDFAFHEKESVNLIKSGRVWYGELFDMVTSYNFNFVFPNIDASSQVCIITDYAVRSTSAASKVTLATQSVSKSFTLPTMDSKTYACGTCEIAQSLTNVFCFNPTGSNFDLNISFSKGSSTSSVWLNYIELTARRFLKMTGSQMKFRDQNAVGINEIAEYSLSGASSDLLIWDITNPVNITNQIYSISGSAINFRSDASVIREYIAFSNTSGFLKPIKAGKLESQNLHSLQPKDLIIVYHPTFAAEANRLADIHRQRDSLTVLLVTPQQIYNEFSSGSQDITAIKDFIKMLYDRGQHGSALPKYLLLFGDASYSYKNNSGNSNFVPSYQSPNSLSRTGSYVSDDYFGLLDRAESAGLNEKVDIGIGRFPVQTVAEAKAMVDKVDIYTAPFNSSQLSLENCSGIFSSSPHGDWRNKMVFVGDDQDNNTHINQANDLATIADTSKATLNYNIDKIFFDAYQQQSTPGGQKYPEVQEAINLAVNKGALTVNYTGHGGEVGWAHERVLEVADIRQWKNKPRMPVFITATCEFSRFDDPGRVSAGEYVFLNAAGGAIALLSTTRLVYAAPNFTLNKFFYKHAFSTDVNKSERLGTICRNTKNDAAPNSSGTNHRNFSLLGDPALKLAYPKYNIVTTYINSPVTTNQLPITISALGKVTIKGYIADRSGNKLTSYNGIVYPTVFDKPDSVMTLANDKVNDPSYKRSFILQKDIIYKGKASVVNGEFSFTFVVPKDISYSSGNGRVSYYAAGELGDASGSFENFKIGGADTNAVADNIGPNIALYMNDKKFINGGVTDQNPNILAYISDSSGVNTVGNGIGHDLVAILDANTDKTIVLNDYYEADLNSYQSGVVRYPLSKLADGPHTIKLKVWDVYNNSSDAVADFVVATSAAVALKHVLNYPNPFTTRTAFYFEHNQPCAQLDVQIQIFTVSGKLVKTIDKKVKCEGYRSDSIEWDGLDDYGDSIGKGVYVYRLKVAVPNGSFADKFEKLVILK